MPEIKVTQAYLNERGEKLTDFLREHPEAASRGVGISEDEDGWKYFIVYHGKQEDDFHKFESFGGIPVVWQKTDKIIKA